jgi:hypothetical protein
LGPRLGISVALSADGTTALVGARDAEHLKGAAYVFHVSDAGSWSSSKTPTATLTSQPGPAAEQLFGYSVALSADGTTAFVGAPVTGGGEDPPGAIYVFHVAAEDAWASSSTPTATLTATDGVIVGTSLALSPDGTTLVAGAPYLNNLAGGAYVFHVPSEGAWVSTSTPTATVSNDDPIRAADHEGDAVAISGDGTTVLVSDGGPFEGSGGALVYHASAEDAWTTSSTPTAILTDSTIHGAGSLGAGLAVSADGTLAVIASPKVGPVDVFHASGEAAWASTSTPTATLTKAGGSANDFFGRRVAVSGDGTAVFVTAPGVHNFRGAVYVFRVAGEGAWASSSAPTATLTNSGGRVGDALEIGPAVSADGATALAGAPEVTFETGAAYVFHVADASSWATSSTPTAILTDSALDQCVVPRLSGLKIAAAKASLKARGCRLGRVTRVRSTHRMGRVLSQNRKPGARLSFNAKVNVKIGK